uniref:60S ribosomal protein L36 n=1 Tax=Panagrellus redivivus TaxID=6233 RepID=A0A7E4VGL1_PANRE
MIRVRLASSDTLTVGRRRFISIRRNGYEKTVSTELGSKGANTHQKQARRLVRAIAMYPAGFRKKNDGKGQKRGAEVLLKSEGDDG